VNVIGVTVEMGARTLVAWEGIRDFLEHRGDEWSSRAEIVEAGCVASDLLPQSVDKILMQMARWGVIKKRYRDARPEQGYRLNPKVEVEVKEWKSNP